MSIFNLFFFLNVFLFVRFVDVQLDIHLKLIRFHQLNLISISELLAQTVFKRRRVLPATSPDTSQVSMLGILRKAIGKDLSKISLPVILNEPLSILQVTSINFFSNLQAVKFHFSSAYPKKLSTATYWTRRTQFKILSTEWSTSPRSSFPATRHRTTAMAAKTSTRFWARLSNW